MRRWSIVWSSLIVLGTPAMAQTAAGAGAPWAARQALLTADKAVADSARSGTLARALGRALSDDAMLMLGGQRTIRGRASAVRALEAFDAGGPYQVDWQALRVELSRDGRDGVTYGVAALAPRSNQPMAMGRYLAYWVERDTTWRMRAFILLLPGAAGVTMPLDSAPPDRITTQAAALRRVDSLYSLAATRIGGAAAFTQFAAPDAVMLPARDALVEGRADIHAAQSESLKGIDLAWWPCAARISDSGDFGFTIGDAEFHVRAEAGGPQTVYTKYLTVWRKQPDGSWKYILDAGSRRPPPAAGEGRCTP